MEQVSVKKTVVISLILTAIALISVFAAPLFAVHTFASQTADSTTRSYEDQIADAERRQQEAKDELGKIWNDQYSTHEKIEQLDLVIQRNADWKQLAQDYVESIYAQIDEKNSAIEEVTVRIDNQRQSLMNHMRETYMEQDVDLIEVLLSSKGLLDFLEKLDYVDAVLNYDRKLIAQLNEEKVLLEQYEAALHDAEAKQVEEVRKYEAIIHENEEAKQLKLQYMEDLEKNENLWLEEYAYANAETEKLNNELQAYLAELTEKERKEAEARALAEQQHKEALAQAEREAYEKAQREAQQQQEAYRYNGTNACWPLQAGVSGRVSSEWGWRWIWGLHDKHLGIDLACPSGTEVYAYSGGTVVTSTNHYSYGNYVVINHGNGLTTLYAHMADRQVSAGDTVVAGQLIGHVGLTGSTSGYHLHFEVRINGETVNPRDYIVFPSNWVN